ncbi:MAG TPA: hypothetical protein VMU70_01110 [Candidatus Tyrphobacter sp.]|nr:hypothetical protein [Candidatus Tyrphobacter sp.]
MPLLITALLISFAFSSPYGYLVTNKRLILVTFSSLFVGNVPSLTSGNFSWIYYQDILDIRLHKSLLDKIFGTGKIIFTVKMGPYVANKFLVGRGLTPSGISSGHKLVFSLVNNPDETLTKIKEIAGENKSAGPEAAQAFNVSDFLKTPPASQIIITVLITLGAIALFAALIYFFSIRP